MDAAYKRYIEETHPVPQNVNIPLRRALVCDDNGIPLFRLDCVRDFPKYGTFSVMHMHGEPWLVLDCNGEDDLR